MRRISRFLLLLAAFALLAAAAAPACLRAHRRHLEETADKALHHLDNASDLYLHPANERIG